jgi:thiol-disulfide isomerase/thioredoxin
MCLVAKPIVDGLERELAGRADVIRLDATGDLGSEMARRFSVSGLPTLLVFDGQGIVVYRQSGPPSREKVLEAVQAVAD